MREADTTGRTSQTPAGHAPRGMCRAFLGNFNFEYELVARAADQPRGEPAAVPGGMAACWLPMAASDDVVLALPPEDGVFWSAGDLPDLAAMGVSLARFIPPEEFTRCQTGLQGGGTAPEAGRHFELVPWGCGPAAVQYAGQFNLRYDPPPFDVVRTVNSRAFRCALERALGVDEPGMAVVESIEELRATLRGRPGRWIIKSNYGMAGREALRGRGASFSAAQCLWAERRLAGAGPLVVEPWLDLIEEAGLQFEIPREGAPVLCGIAPQLTAAGTYRGSRLDDDGALRDRWSQAIEVGHKAAARLQGLGYFGPLGIDCCIHRDERGQARLRPLMDLNARMTMGRLALGWRRLVPAGWCGTWLHLPVKGAGAQAELWKRTRELARSCAGRARVLVTSFYRPRVAPLPRMSVLVLAQGTALRAQCEELLLRIAPG